MTENVTRPHFDFVARRIILACGFALAIAASPLAVALTVPSVASAEPAASCPAGEEEDMYTGSCLPHTVPNSPTNNGYPASPVQENAGGLSSVDGVPCTGGNSGQCIGLQEDAPKFVQPPTSIDGG